MSKPKIIYSLIVREPDTVLAHYSDAKGNFPQVTTDILPTLQSGGYYAYNLNDKYDYHFISVDGIKYMALVSVEFSRRVSFAFLEQIRQALADRYGNKLH